VKTTTIIIAIALSAGAFREAAAQWNVARFGLDRNRIHTSVGVDPAVVTAAGYARVVQLFGENVQFDLEIGLATAKLDTRDFRSRLQVRSSLVRWRSLRLAGSATFVTRGTQNNLYTGFNFGSDFSATAGVYQRGWFAAAEGGFDKAIITHVHNSDRYKTWFYPGAKDGWYLDNGGTFHGGVTAGVTIGKTELMARVGRQATQAFGPLLPPMYGSVGLGVGF